MTEIDRYALNKAQLRAAFERAAPHYDQAAVLQREVGTRLLERLALMRLLPEVVLDIGAGTGHSTQGLARHYRKARLIALDLSPGMLRQTRRRSPWWRAWQLVCGDAECLPLADASCDLIFSNLTLQWCQNLAASCAEMRRVLRPGGLLLFSTLGPDSLKELRASWAVADGHSHVNAFVDMHDVGDSLLHARFADPVMDMEQLTMTYVDAFALMRDLKTLGAHNVTAGRAHGLTGKNRLKTMLAAYEGLRRDGLLPATYEVVYGHAWVPAKIPSAVPRDQRFVSFEGRHGSGLHDPDR